VDLDVGDLRIAGEVLFPGLSATLSVAGVDCQQRGRDERRGWVLDLDAGASAGKGRAVEVPGGRRQKEGFGRFPRAGLGDFR